MKEQEYDDPLVSLPESAATYRSRFATLGEIHEEFRFPELTVELHVTSSF
jgi:hypothetical protein